MVNGILNDVAPLQMCGCQFTEILLHMHLKFVYTLRHIQPIRITSYMEISIYFHVLCNYSQNYLLIRISPPPSHPKTPTTHSHYQWFSCLQWLYMWISQIQLTFIYTAEMGLITEMHTYKSLNLVQHLFLNTLHCTL